MKAYGGIDVYIHIFLTLVLVGGEWSASRLGHFTPGERTPGIHWTGGLVGPRAGLDDVEKRKFLTLSGLEIRPLGRPACNQSLDRLRYPGSILICKMFKFNFLHEDTIILKLILEEIWLEGVDWINLIQDTNTCRSMRD
jgi:hypothetical protein